MATLATTPRTYTAEQEAARAYMQAQKVLDALAEDAKPHKDAQKAALDLLSDSFGEGKTTITGAWNTNLTFTHAVADTVKWAKVAEALRSHLNAEQAAELDRLIRVHSSTRTTRHVKV